MGTAQKGLDTYVERAEIALRFVFAVRVLCVCECVSRLFRGMCGGGIYGLLLINWFWISVEATHTMCICHASTKCCVARSEAHRSGDYRCDLCLDIRVVRTQCEYSFD